MIPGLCTLLYKPRTVGSFSVNLSTPSVSGTSTPGPVVSGPVTATPVGGTAPYTYAWSYYTGDPSMARTSPTAATTTFSETLASSSITSAQFFCTVTDAGAKSVPSSIVTCTLRATRS